MPTHRKRYKGEVRELILNPTVRRPTPVILLPQDILRHLPVASSWSEVSEAASFSHALRSRVNKMIGEIWRAKTKKEQRERKRAMLHEKELMADLLTVVKNGKVKAYNFVRDERGVLAWQKVIECVQIDFPFKISVDSSKEGLLKCVRSIVGQFRFLVEERGFNKMLWNKKRPNKEKVSQMLFFAVAHSYCRANDVDISPEMDTGSGLVDFKFAKGYSNRHIVEVKLSNNPNVLNGYKIQLEAYKRSEEVDAGTFVLVDVGGMGKKLDALYEIQEKSRKKLSAIEYVDARVKPSASKRR